MKKILDVDMFELFLNEPDVNIQQNRSPLEDDLLQKHYQELVVTHHIQSDSGQKKVLSLLQQLLNSIAKNNDQDKQSVFSRFISAPQFTPKSIYIHGDVGRGKTMLMDLFFEACPIQSKRRVHFHAFMQEVHEYMHMWRQKNEGDALPSLAENIRKTSLLLCFDEFHVTDIADAMLLARLFTRLFKQGIIVVATSNQCPDDLYKNGLQRELFLPFIALLKQSADILELVANEDYRLCHFKGMSTTFYCEPTGADEFLQQSFNELTNDGFIETRNLKVKGRQLKFTTVHGDILMTSFDEVCGKTLGPADYLAIASEFNTILIARIPCLSMEIRDQVRRFITLIDALYERNVKLICTSAVSLEQLSIEDSHFNFKRTRSRLCEMQSDNYLRRKHLS